jgi:CRP/FNR family transcriptional regulator
MAVDSNLLHDLSYFSGLNAAELEAIKPLFLEKTVQRGELIFFEGEPANTLYFLISGIVKLFKTSAQGKEQIISLARPYEVLNDISIFDDGSNPMSAQAMSTANLYGIKKERLETTLGQHPQVSARISLVEDLSFKHVIGRVAKILLEHTGDGAGSAQRLTQQEMAAMAGTAREVVARSLKTLEERGLIRLDRQRIIISDKRALQEVINEDM